MGLLRHNEKVAVGIGANRLHLLVGRGNGQVKTLYSGGRDLPSGTLRVGMRSPSINDGPSLADALSELVAEARAAGSLRRVPETVALLLADGAFKLAVAPIEGNTPGPADGARMARWMLRDLVPGQSDEVRADWSVMGGDGDAAGRCFLSVGALDALLTEYERLVADVGWTAGRLVPWSLAAAAASGAHGENARSDLVLCDANGALGAIFYVGGVPRLHRSWRTALSPEDVAGELPALRRYASDHLQSSFGSIWLCGDDAWVQATARQCDDAQVTVNTMNHDAALLAAIED